MVDPEDLRALADIGFIAWSRGLDAEAARIFEAVRIVRPNQEAGYIGAALVALQRGDPLAAVRMLRQTPPSNLARTFMGLSLLKLGERQEGVEMLEDVIAHGGDAPVGALARALLEGQRGGDGSERRA